MKRTRLGRPVANRRTTVRAVAWFVGAALATACASGGLGDDTSGGATTSPDAPSPTSTLASTSASPCESEQRFPTARTDSNVSGNRVVDGSIDLAGAGIRRVELGAAAQWIVPDPSAPSRWYVALDDGSAVIVEGDGSVVDAGSAPLGAPEVGADGEARSAWANHDLFDDPLPDARVVRTADVAVALAQPTDRYAHAVLGDNLEAGAIEVVELCPSEDEGRRTVIEVPAPDVIEGVAPLLADIDSDGIDEILVTLSNNSGGARLAVWELDGTFVAESDPIGRGNRWRNQLAVGPFGPGGETEIVDVRTPHIGGTVQAFRLVDTGDGAVLERVAASQPDYTTHVIRSGNLDMGLAVDANDDGQLDAVVVSADRSRLVALTRVATEGGWDVVADIELDGTLQSNIAGRAGTDGRATLALGVDQYVLLIG